MKKRKIILLVIFIIGVVSLLLLSSFMDRNACDYANSNLEYIKSEMNEAVKATDFELSKYHAFKALNSIEKTRANFLDCGCQETIESLEKVSYYLKKGTNATSLEVSTKFFYVALESASDGINVLKESEQGHSSPYNKNILMLNTENALAHHSYMATPEFKQLHQHGHECLLGFKISLGKVVTDVPCKEAHAFISRIHDEARLKLLNTDLSDARKHYHQRVETIAQDALSRLGNCPLDH